MGTPPACAPLRWRRRIHRSGITRRPAERKAGLSAVRGIYYVRFHHWYRAFKGSRSGNLVDKLINDVWFNWWLMVNGLIEGNISTKAGSFAPKYTVVIFVDNLVRTKCLKMFLEPLLFHPNLSKPIPIRSFLDSQCIWSLLSLTLALHESESQGRRWWYLRLAPHCCIQVVLLQSQSATHLIQSDNV